jgi:uncharacterized phage protein gp47/JayE
MHETPTLENIIEQIEYHCASKLGDIRQDMES